MIERLLARIEDALIGVSAALIFFLMAFICVIIFSRMLGYGIVGYIDVIELLLPAIAILGIATLQRKGEHLGMELLIDKVTNFHLRKLINVIGLGIGLFAVLILCNKTFLHFQRAYTFGDSTIDAQIPTWPSKIVVPIALGILAIRLVLLMVREIRREPGAEAVQ